MIFRVEKGFNLIYKFGPNIFIGSSAESDVIAVLSFHTSYQYMYNP